MPLVGRERRGLPEIVAFTGTMLAVAGVLIAQLATGHEMSHELEAAFVGLILLVTARGTQSAMERGASSEQRNHESSEFRKAIDELRREAGEFRQANAINRVLMLTAPTKKGESS